MTCIGSGRLPRVMGERLPDGTVTGLCIGCQSFQPMSEVVPPSRPEWRREFRIIDHEPDPPSC